MCLLREGGRGGRGSLEERHSVKPEQSIQIFIVEMREAGLVGLRGQKTLWRRPLRLLWPLLALGNEGEIH